MSIPPLGISDVNYFEKGHDVVITIISPENTANDMKSLLRNAEGLRAKFNEKNSSELKGLPNHCTIPKRLAKTISLLVIFGLVSSLAMAGELTARDAQTLTFYFENDTFFGTDYLYTNGVRLSWTSPDLEDCRYTSTMGSWAYSLIGWLPFTKDPGFRRSVSLSIGQNMYTPEDKDTASKQLIKLST